MGLGWLIYDVFGRRWRLWIFRPGRQGEAGGMLSDDARRAVRAIVSTSLARPERFDFASEALFEIYSELTIGVPISRHEWLRDDPTSRRRAVDTVSEVLERAASIGRLGIEQLRGAQFAAPPVRESTPDTVRQQRPAPSEQEGTTHFELRVLDEAGAPIDGLEIEFSVGGARKKVITNGRGIARLDGADASFGAARVVSPEAVEEIVEPRRRMFRPVKLPEGEHASIRLVRDLGASVSLEAEVQHTLAIVPNHRRVRLIGMHFDTNKSFLLPSAMHGIRELHAIFQDAAKTQFLVVGHTDRHGTRAYNEQLSLERAKSIIAFMKDDVDAWNDLFRAPRPEKRWGDREVNAMLSALPEGGPSFTTPEKEGKDPQAVKRFQQFSNDTRGTALKVDGKAGPATRRALIEAYMALSHTSFPAGATTVAHGCGPNHPPPDEGNVPPSDAEMRRVDIPYHVFFHPSTRNFNGVYPFARDYIDMISRYMLRDQDFEGNHAMVNQHAVAGKRPVFVFPVGSPTLGFGSIPEQASLLRLLQEVNYILQRMDDIGYPIHHVGFCAASAYSQGCDALKTMLDTPFPEFDNGHLREIYGFDLFRQRDVGAVCRSLGAWFRGGADTRKLRIYTQEVKWRTGIRASTPAGTVTTGPSNATEDEAASSSLLFDPVATFWTGMAREVTKPHPFGHFDDVPGDFFAVHHMHPSLFMTHALKLSSFSD